MSKNNMAVNKGLGKVYYSIIGQGGTIGIPKELNSLISFAVNPSESVERLFAGDTTAIIETSATISGTIGVPAISNEAMCDLFGYKMGGKGELIYSTKAVRPCVVLQIEQNNAGGVVDNITLWKCKLSLPATQGNTATDKISFGTKELAFEVIPVDGVYMTVASSDEEGYVAPDYAVAPIMPTPKTA